MKNSKLVKISLIVIMSIVMIAFMIGNVSAENYQDLTTAVNGTNTATTGNNTTNRTSNNTSSNSSRNNTATSALNSANATNRTNTTNNTSTYNNTTLPHTGIGDSIPVAVLVVVFGISAVYAYKKIKEYKNI